MIHISKSSCLLGALLIVACVEHEGVELTTVHTSRPGVFGPTASIPMAEYPLEEQEDFDALETHLVARIGLEKVIAVYLQLAESAAPKDSARDALLLQRLALLHLRTTNDSGRLHQAFAVADRLRTDAPNSPHTLYLLGHVTSLLLPMDSDHVYRVQRSQQDVARRLEQHWSRLLSLEPEYVAPAGKSAADIRTKLEAIRAALARSEQPSAPDSEQEASTVEVPNTSLEERRLLHRLENGDQAIRRTLCRERMERRGRNDTAASEAGRWLELRCAVELEDALRGHDALKRLLATGARVEPCRWLKRLGAGQGQEGKDLNAAMEKRGISPCSPKEN